MSVVFKRKEQNCKDASGMDTDRQLLTSSARWLENLNEKSRAGIPSKTFQGMKSNSVCNSPPSSFSIFEIGLAIGENTIPAEYYYQPVLGVYLPKKKTTKNVVIFVLKPFKTSSSTFLVNGL